MATSSGAKQKSDTHVKSELPVHWNKMEASGLTEATALTTTGLWRLGQCRNLDGRIACAQARVPSPSHPPKAEGWSPLWWIDWVGDWCAVERRGTQDEDRDTTRLAQSGDLGLLKEVSVVWGPEGRPKPSVVGPATECLAVCEWDNLACLPGEGTIQ